MTRDGPESFLLPFCLACPCCHDPGGCCITDGEGGRAVRWNRAPQSHQVTNYMYILQPCGRCPAGQFVAHIQHVRTTRYKHSLSIHRGGRRHTTTTTHSIHVHMAACLLALRSLSPSPPPVDSFVIDLFSLASSAKSAQPQKWTAGEVGNGDETPKRAGAAEAVQQQQQRSAAHVWATRGDKRTWGKRGLPICAPQSTHRAAHGGLYLRV